LANLGHIFFASVALPFWLALKNPSDFLVVIFGIFVAICFWVISIIFLGITFN